MRLDSEIAMQLTPGVEKAAARRRSFAGCSQDDRRVGWGIAAANLSLCLRSAPEVEPFEDRLNELEKLEGQVRSPRRTSLDRGAAH
jgi:hypothetical protein